MEVSDLRTFLAVMDLGSISHAAKALHRVPSGITARIMLMEEELGVQLFLREKKRLLPTARSQTLYTYARKICALMDEAEAVLKSGLEADMNSASTMLALAEHQMRMGKEMEAKELFGRIITQNPKSGEAKVARDYLGLLQ